MGPGTGSSWWCGGSMMTCDVTGPRVLIVDTQVGNLLSVQNAFRYLGCDASVGTREALFRDATHVVVPGVGTFRDGMDRLSSTGCVELLADVVLNGGKPMLGICLGMQLLADEGREYGRYR